MGLKIDRKKIKEIIIVWALYLIIINGYLLILDRLGHTDVKNHSIKEVCFALWGWAWDGMHYIKIATQGYEFPLQAFFPLYPMIIRVLDYVFPFTLSYRINILILLGLLAGAYVLMDYMKIEVKKRIPILIMFLSFPSAFFLQANYVDALYIFISLVGLYFLLNKRYLYAAVMAGLLSAVKVSGISLGIIIIFDYTYNVSNGFKEIPVNIKKHVFSIIATSILSFSGILLYFLYLQNNFGSYNIFFEAQEKWGREIVGTGKDIKAFIIGFIAPIIKAVRNGDTTIYRRIHEILFFLVSLLCLRYSYRKIPYTIWLFSLAQIIIPISSGTFLSFNRLALLAYPIFLYGISKIAEKTYLYWSLIIILFLSQLLGIYLFFNNVFVG